MDNKTAAPKATTTAQQVPPTDAHRDGSATTDRCGRERALVRKLDLYIAPVMMLLMLISYLDRGNIGFAATQGMTDDIGLEGSQLNVWPLVSF